MPIRNTGRKTKTGKLVIEQTRSGSASDPRDDGRWWAISDEKPAGEALWSTVEMLSSAHAGRHMNDALNYGLYKNQPPYWLGSNARDPWVSGSVEYGGRRVPLNLVKSVIDTASAMLAKNTASLRAFTSGGSWRDQRRARNLTKYVQGVFYLTDYHRHQQRAFKDGCLSQARGAVKFWIDRRRGQILAERAHPRTRLWNDLELDNPRSLYQFQPVAKESLLRAFGDKKSLAEKIEKCSDSVKPVNPAYRRTSGLIAHAQMVDVAEGWHLGDRNDPDSGRHILMINGQVLLDETWPMDMFPFATFSWDDDCDEGWGGDPLADQLAGYQTEISRYLRIYRKALERAASMAGPWVEETGTADAAGENNNGEPWTVRKYRGQPPVFAAPPALGKDFFEFILFQYEKAFAEAGISLLQSQGQKPAGIDSGIGLLQYNDITQTRQVIKGQRYERQTKDAGKIVIALSRRLYAQLSGKAA